MGCGCGGSQAKKQDYQVTMKDGTTKTFKTEMEARAAIARVGAGALRAVPAKV